MRGWHNESARHSLAARGFRVSHIPGAPGSYSGDFVMENISHDDIHAKDVEPLMFTSILSDRMEKKGNGFWSERTWTNDLVGEDRDGRFVVRMLISDLGNDGEILVIHGTKDNLKRFFDLMGTKTNESSNYFNDIAIKVKRYEYPDDGFVAYTTEDAMIFEDTERFLNLWRSTGGRVIIDDPSPMSDEEREFYSKFSREDVQ